MRTAMTVTVPLLAAALLSACSAAPATTATTSSPAGGHGTSASAASDAVAGVGDLSGKSAREIIDALDRTNADREEGPKGSVRQKELVLATAGGETKLPMPADVTYVSVAPYVEQTHECFNHNLASCQGEQVGKAFQVKITDAAGKAIVDTTATTYDNGFVGFWVPRGLKGTMTVSGEGRTGSVPLSTGPDDPTCVTTLKLA